MATERQIGRARQLRRDTTDVEALLWARLRSRQLEGAKFVRQHPIGPYLTESCCRGARLVIELDGGQHADNAADDARTRVIEANGYTVIHFWNNDVLENVEGVLMEIQAALRNARC
jgi:very-short-patch-repair endonuclease